MDFLYLAVCQHYTRAACSLSAIFHGDVRKRQEKCHPWSCRTIQAQRAAERFRHKDMVEQFRHKGNSMESSRYSMES